MSIDIKYRPKIFDEVIGQDVAVTILRATVIKNQYHSAYLLSGPSGTGKTSLGRIFAKAVLCESPVKGNPCCACESCLLFQEEKHFGYRELDAATYGGKDDMVKLRDDANFLSTEKKKIILLDECHDISKQGQDALLKQVEQCPEHLIYIFCTTEPEKLKPTLKKRCTQFQFSRVDSSLIFERLKDICGREKLPYEENALHFIADRSEGHVRDSIKYLEEASYFGPITVDSVSKVVVDHSEDIFNIIANLGHDLAKALDACKKIVNNIPVLELYEQMLTMVSDSVKIIYGYDDFLPRRKEQLIKLRDIHGCSLIEFLSYLMTRDRFIDRVGLQSDIILLHYKFNSNSFQTNIQAKALESKSSGAPPPPPIVTGIDVPSDLQANLTDQTSTSVSVAQLMKLSIGDRQKLLREQKLSHNVSEKEEQPKIHNEWSLPKEERLGEDSFDVEQELSPLEFSKRMVGGRGCET